MNKEELRKIRENLPKGGREILAERFGCSTGHINNVLLGNRSNEKILIAAAEIITSHKDAMQKAAEIVSAL